MSNNQIISVRGAAEHNLKKVDIDIPKHKFVVFTGCSGSGKSTLVFGTVHTEAQRQYLQSLSLYARQFLGMYNKPKLISISGLSPSIAINQKNTSNNPRSTVSTSTEIYDYMRVLFARIGIPYSPATGLPITKQTIEQMVEKILALPEGTKVLLLAPVVRGQKGEYRKELLFLRKQGYERFKIDGIFYEYDEIQILDKNKKHTIEVVVDRIVISESVTSRLTESVETALKLANGILMVEVLDAALEQQEQVDVDSDNPNIMIFSEKFACPISGFTLTEIEPRIFSFNSPYGACRDCDGLGYKTYFDPKLIVPDDTLSLKNGAIAPWKLDSSGTVSKSKFYLQTLEILAKHFGFSIDTPFKDLPEEVRNMLLYGSGNESVNFHYTQDLSVAKISKPFEGIIKYLENLLDKVRPSYSQEHIRRYQADGDCLSCKGMRLNPQSLSVKIGGKNITEVCKNTIDKAIEWFESLNNILNEKEKIIADQALKEILKRLQFLKDVGLSYLTLDRKASTLSGGESQRIRLASQIGSGLSGVLYVLDEPSIGLHQADNNRLLKTIRKLKDLGNTILVVEHDEDTMRAADYLVDMGPGAGIHGGNVIATGTPEEVSNNPNSVTGNYLSGREYIPVPMERRKGHIGKNIVLKGASSNNLKNIDVSIPLGKFNVITGVSGSGKSTFTIHTLYKAIAKQLHNTMAQPGAYKSLSGVEYIDKIIEIDQSPIGRTPRSNPATYTGAFTHIRDWFTGLPKSKMHGYKPGRFSFNVKGGRCETCEGDGVLKIEMHLLPDVYVKCSECDGKRYNKETLEVKYKGKSIADVLSMNVEEAVGFFDTLPLIQQKVIALQEVGLGYMQLGQSATTLSGGEAQRIKLAKELSRKSTGRTLYILDEPTTGLHTSDIKRLLNVLNRLVDAGNTLVVIEHNLDVIKTSDYIVDIGPYGGDKGGEVVAFGTPEEVASNNKSVTGAFLKDVIEKSVIEERKAN